MKFKNYIETESGIKDTSTSPGTAGQVLSSTVTGISWIDPDTLVSAASKLVVVACKNVSGTPILKGTPVYQSGTVGATDVIEVEPADATISTGYLPAIGILQTTLNNNGFGNVVITGEFLNYSTADIPTDRPGGEPFTGDTVYLAAGGGLTCIKPTGAGNAIQNVGLMGKVSGGNSGSITVSSIMRANDVPNLPTGKIWVGDGNTIVSDVVYLDETNGRMGIGTTSPTALLTLESSSFDPYPGVDIKSTSTYPGSKIRFLNSSGSEVSTIESWSNPAISYLQLNHGYTTASSSTLTLDDGFLYLSTAGSERMRIASNGNVGIGTTSPNRLLTVQTTGTGSYLALNSSSNNTTIGSDINGAFLVYDDTASTYRMVIKPTTGNVGIGTTSPSDKLEVAAANSQLRLTDTDDSKFTQFSYSSGVLVVRNNSTTTTTNQFTLDAAGKMGIGTTSPNEKLEVNGSVRVTGAGLDVGYGNNSNNFVQIGNGRTTSGFAFIDLVGDTTYSDYGLRLVRNNGGANTNSEIIHRGTGALNLNVTQAGSITLKTSNLERVRINSSGNVGIGTTSPATKLHVFGTASSMPSLGAAPSAAQLGGSTYGTLFSTLTSGRGVIQQGRSDGTPGSYDLLLQPVGGNVGIGTPSARTKLHVSGLTGDDDPALGSSTAPFFVSNTSTSYGLNIGVNNAGASWLQAQSNSSAIAYEMSLNPLGGNVGVGFINPAYKLDVNGTGRFTDTLYYSSLVQQSQADTKKDIANIDKNKATAIPFKQYKYKTGDTERVRYGVIVEDIEQHYPELVHIGEDGIKGVSYIDLLVKRVAELEKELEDISLTPGPKGDTGATGVQGPAGADGRNGSDGRNGADGNDHLNNVESIAFNEKSGQLEITIKGHKDPFRFNPAK